MCTAVSVVPPGLAGENPQSHASIVAAGAGWAADTQGDLGSGCQPGPLNDHMEDSCFDNLNTCPEPFLEQE